MRLESKAPVGRLWLAVFVGYASFGIGIQVLPATAAERFPTTALGVGTAVTIGSLAAAATRPFAGRRADVRDARAVVLGGGLLATAGSVLQLVSPSLEPMILARLLVGAGEAALFTGALAWVLREAGPDGRGKLVGRFGLSMWGGLACGPPAGAALAALAGVDAAWAACLALAVLAIAAVAPAPYRAPAGSDRPVPLLAGEALMPALALGLAAFGYGTLNAFVILRLEAAGVAGPEVALGVFAAAFLLARFFGSPLIDRVPAARLMAIAAALEAAGLAALAASPRPAVVFPALVLAGAGTALVFPILATFVSHAVPAHRRGSAVGTMTSSWDLAIAVAGPVGGVVAAGQGLSAPFALAAAVALLAAVPAWRAAQRPARRRAGLPVQEPSPTH